MSGAGSDAADDTGYQRARVEGAKLIVRQDAFPFVAAAIREAGTLYDFAAGHPEREAIHGRATLFAIPGPSACRWIVRKLTHGGALARLTGDRFLRLGRLRPFNEVRLSQRLLALGIPTPKVMAGIVYPAGPIYRGEVARQVVEQARDLAACLFGERRMDSEARRQALAAAGRLVGALHRIGLQHADLNLRNLLIETVAGGRPRAYILDLEKSRVVGDLSRRKRARMVARLRRSVRRFEQQTRQRLTEAEWEAFMDAYREAAGP